MKGLFVNFIHVPFFSLSQHLKSTQHRKSVAEADASFQQLDAVFKHINSTSDAQRGKT
jgi:hypothetical protein